MSNSSPKASSTTAKAGGVSPRAILLTVKGLGHIPALKNSMFAIVKPENREWKRRCVHSFVSQLHSSSPMKECETLTLPFLQSLIASLPPDDHWRNIPKISLESVKVPPGEEGADIVIEPLLNYDRR